MKKDIIIQKLKQEYPNPKCELEYNSPFELLVAVVLSAQCTDKRVNQVTRELFKNYNTAEKIAAMDIVELENAIKSCGFYHNKAKAIKSLSIDIVSRFNGEFPKTKQELKTLAGVGEKTANVVVSLVYNEPAIAVDTHVFRVSKRLKLAKEEDDVLKVEQKLKRHFKRDVWCKLHHQLVLFGRYYCTAKNPRCETCKLKEYCIYKKTNIK